MSTCPCGLDKIYLNCCGQYIEGAKPAPTPEALMRSRYTAYTKADTDYIANTMQGVAAQEFDKESARIWAKQIKWLKLTVLNVSKVRVDQTIGFVEFIAESMQNGKKQILHEKSEFKKIDGNWYYINGQLLATPTSTPNKIGRNDPCPCGSGKKFKKCCALN